MLQTKIFTAGPVAAGQSISLALQFDAPFPDVDYATGISLSSNSLTPAQAAAGVRGLLLTSTVKRVDGLDITLHNPDPSDCPGDTINVWASTNGQ